MSFSLSHYLHGPLANSASALPVRVGIAACLRWEVWCWWCLLLLLSFLLEFTGRFFLLLLSFLTVYSFFIALQLHVASEFIICGVFRCATYSLFVTPSPDALKFLPASLQLTTSKLFVVVGSPVPSPCPTCYHPSLCPSTPHSVSPPLKASAIIPVLTS